MSNTKLLEDLVDDGFISKGFLNSKRKIFSDKEILCFVLLDKLHYSYKYAEKQLHLSKNTIVTNYYKILLHNLGIYYLDSSEKNIKTLLNKKDCISEDLEILKDEFSSTEIMCYVLHTCLKLEDIALKLVLPFLTKDEIISNSSNVSEFIEQVYIEQLEHGWSGRISPQINSNSYYNGPRFGSILIPTDDGEEQEDVSPDRGYLEDIHNNEGF